MRTGKILLARLQVLDTWESLGPGQWTQMTLFDTLLEDAMAWNTFLASVVTELIETWLTKFEMPQFIFERCGFSS